MYVYLLSCTIQVAVSVFVLDKEDPLIRGLAKTQKEALLEAFRREIAILKQFSQAKPMPCPSVLRLFQVRHFWKL